jgi:hypothetical protein
MKKNNLYFSALVLFLGLSFTNCHSKSDNSGYQTTALLVNYLNDLLSGNCAVVTKQTTAAGVATYSAQGTTIPKGGCSASALGSTYTTTSSDIVTKTDAYFTKITTILDTYSACSTISSIIKGENAIVNGAATQSAALRLGGVGLVKTLTTSTNIEALATANSAADSTNAFGVFSPKSCNTVKIGLLYTAGVYCSSAAASTTAQDNVKYYNVSSITSDMGISLEGHRSLLNLARTTTDSVNFYTKSAITAMRMMTSAELVDLSSSTNSPKADAYVLTYLINAWGSATGQTSTYSSCLAALTAGDSTTKSALIRLPNAYYITTPNTDITFADRQAVTTPYVPYLYCKYGAGFTAATSTVTASSTAAIGFCPSTYTQF